MKKVLVYVPVVLCLIILGAHFMRYENLIGVFGSLGLIALLFVRRPWVARLTQIILVIGALEWSRTLYVLVQERAATGQPVTWMVVILGVVVLITFCSALLFQTAVLKRVYRMDRSR
jgi:hypothetical protein